MRRDQVGQLVIELGGLREQELHACGNRLQRQDGDAVLDGRARRAGQRGDAVELLVQGDATEARAQMLRSDDDQALQLVDRLRSADQNPLPGDEDLP